MIIMSKCIKQEYYKCKLKFIEQAMKLTTKQVIKPKPKTA